ncbi:hypothetical protein FXB40_41410 [Bradyrhizobium rifense]|uniref:Uncharacterized protein n=1 Tax=Bradyrhizobium rifense TaxID=515499 RepID=A0A5D3KCG5_9BRAD|nr:hypothetical protein FXB40_41410 [Bradyrhizobium rifense]
MSERPISPRQLWWLAAGFTVWCSALVSLYGIHGIGCAFAWSTGSLRLSLAATLLAHLLVLGWMWRATGRAGLDSGFGETQAFLQWVVLGTLITSLVATVLTFGPALLLATCI